MTRKSITQDLAQIEKIIQRATVIHLAFSTDGPPCIVPMSFGYQDGVLYFHSRKSGAKIELLAANDQVAFALQSDVRLLEKDDPCGYSFEYASVRGWGRARLIEDLEGKRAALSEVARQYSSQPMICSDEVLSGVVTFRLDIEEMTLKTSSLE